MGSAQEFVNPT